MTLAVLALVAIVALTSGGGVHSRPPDDAGRCPQSERLEK